MRVPLAIVCGMLLLLPDLCKCCGISCDPGLHAGLGYEERRGLAEAASRVHPEADAGVPSI